MIYEPAFLAEHRADALMGALLTEELLTWHQERFSIFGKTRAAPRLTAWCGDAGLDYRYTGHSHACTGWPSMLNALRDELADRTGIRFNLVLANLYRSGDDHMGWHKDNEAGCTPQVASVSLGATRRFRWRTADTGASQALDLEHGSLMVFDAFQAHRLCPTRRPVGQRVNLTFRRLA